MIPINDFNHELAERGSDWLHHGVGGGRGGVVAVLLLLLLAMLLLLAALLFVVAHHSTRPKLTTLKHDTCAWRHCGFPTTPCPGVEGARPDRCDGAAGGGPRVRHHRWRRSPWPLLRLLRAARTYHQRCGALPQDLQQAAGRGNRAVISFHCLSLLLHRLPLVFHYRSLTVYRLSLTFHRLSFTFQRLSWLFCRLSLDLPLPTLFVSPPVFPKHVLQQVVLGGLEFDSEGNVNVSRNSDKVGITPSPRTPQPLGSTVLLLGARRHAVQTSPGIHHEDPIVPQHFSLGSRARPPGPHVHKN